MRVCSVALNYRPFIGFLAAAISERLAFVQVGEIDVKPQPVRDSTQHDRSVAGCKPQQSNPQTGGPRRRNPLPNPADENVQLEQNDSIILPFVMSIWGDYRANDSRYISDGRNFRRSSSVRGDFFLAAPDCVGVRWRAEHPSERTSGRSRSRPVLSELVERLCGRTLPVLALAQH